MLWLVYFKGMGWREQRRLREEEKDKQWNEKKAAKEENGEVEESTSPALAEGDVGEDENETGLGRPGRHDLGRTNSYHL